MHEQPGALSLRKAKNLWITVPLVYDIRRISNTGSLTTIFGGRPMCYSHFNTELLQLLLKRSPKTFGIKKKRPL